jgi:ABC-type sugar transport system permease subunit
MRWRRYITPLAMVLPTVVLYTLFITWPLVQGAWISLHRWDGLGTMKWIGLDNYGFVAADNVFWQAMRNTLVYAVGVTVAKNVLGLLLAIVLNRRLRGLAFFRTAAFVPVTLSFVVIGVLWTWIFNPTFGLLNNLLNALGLGFLIQGWLSDPNVALWSVMVVDVWKWTGFHMVLFLAALQTIPADLYEAAALDGAGRWQTFLHVTLPGLRPVIVFSVLLSLVGAFVANYDVVYVMTKGGPLHATEVALTWIVSTALRFSNVGKADAMSMILFAVVAVIAVMQLPFLIRREERRR